MRNATPPARAPLHDYDLGIQATPEGETRTHLTERRADVAELHLQYEAAAGRPHLMTRTTDWSKAEKLAQLSLYPMTQKGGALEDLRGVMFKAAGRRCLLCGADRPTSLDHVLPKSKHPALSVLPLNLVGACEPCNRRKQSTCLADPARQFIHPYFDQVPAGVVWLRCTPLSADGVLAPAFRIAAPTGMNAELTARLAWQFTRLQLGDYYADEAVLHCTGQAGGWLEVLDDPGAGLRATLEGSLRSISGPYGVNHWMAALLRGMIEDEVFLRTARDVLDRHLADNA
jgi:5-methylcytosine-specific restriction endonuclease McrA